MSQCKIIIRPVTEEVRGDIGNDWSYDILFLPLSGFPLGVVPPGAVTVIQSEHTIEPDAGSQRPPRDPNTADQVEIRELQCGQNIELQWILNAREHDFFTDDKLPSPVISTISVTCPGPRQEPLPPIDLTIDVVINEKGLFAWVKGLFGDDSARLILKFQITARCED